MKKKDAIKRHLIDTTKLLLKEVYYPDELTVRKLADEAHVAVGLVNYHFGSKEALMLIAINEIIDDSSKASIYDLYDTSIEPIVRLRKFLIGVSLLVKEYKVYSRIILKHELLSDSFDTPQFIVPILKEMRPGLSDGEIKYLAIQIVAPLQYIFFKEEGFNVYMDIEEEDYDVAIDTVLKQLGLL